MAAFAFFVSLEIFLAAVFLCIIPFVAVFAITDVVKPIFCWIFSLSLVSMVFCRHFMLRVWLSAKVSNAWIQHIYWEPSLNWEGWRLFGRQLGFSYRPCNV